MRHLYEAWLIQIDITNSCIRTCAHCTRAIAHHREPSFASLEQIERALRSLVGWRKGVGCMGGEPTLHPQFPEVCRLYQRYFPRFVCGLFTSSRKNVDKHRELIDQTFGILHLNPHDEVGYHQPMLVAAEEIIEDPVLREELIDDCWLQRTWSPTINSKGAFFCEVAATMDLLFDGPGGYPLEPGWWARRTGDFSDQRGRYCGQCSIPIPMERVPSTSPVDYVSPGNAERLRAAGSPLAERGGLRVISDPLTRADIERARAETRTNRDPGNYAKAKELSPYLRLNWRFKLRYRLEQLKLRLRGPPKLSG